jgi:two-component system cell cycle sensor histidine kinase/response regulator CckA
MSHRAGRTVLIVDDDLCILALMSASLSRFQIRLLSAQSPADALKIAQDNSIALDLIITDIHMPEMTGIDLVRRIRGLHPAIKVVYISGAPGGHAMVLAEDRSSPFLRKPFTIRELEETIGPVLARVARGSG